jgi:beta-phosphoglucomutase
MNNDRTINRQSRAVLWDLDGTLIDSTEYHWLAWRKTLAAEKYDLTPERFLASFGQRNDVILRDYLGPDLPASEIERIGEAKEQLYRELVRTRGIELLPGVARWLAQLSAGGWRQAITTSAPRLNVEAILAALGLEGRFDAIIAAEDVERGKPDPQIFLLAAAKFKTPPRRCVVVEDAPAGIEGARRAGMRSIGVLSTRSDLKADLVTASLAALPPDAFDRLLDEDESPAAAE